MYKNTLMILARLGSPQLSTPDATGQMSLRCGECPVCCRPGSLPGPAVRVKNVSLPRGRLLLIESPWAWQGTRYKDKKNTTLKIR